MLNLQLMSILILEKQEEIPKGINSNMSSDKLSNLRNNIKETRGLLTISSNELKTL